MRRRRAAMTPEQRDAARAKAREAMRRHRAAMTPEQRDAARAKAREVARARRAAAQGSRAATQGPGPQTPEEVRAHRLRSSVARLARKLGDTPLTDADGVIRVLRKAYSNINTQRTYLARLIASVRDDPGYPKPALETLRQEMLRLIKQVRHDYGENDRSDRDKKGWVDWRDLRAARERCEREGTLRERAVLSLYMDFPPRRAEYRTLRVRRTMPPDDDTENYVVLNKDGSVRCVTLASYKTSKKYGRYDIPGARYDNDALAAYCANLAPGDWLWRRGWRSPSGWSQMVGDLTLKWTGRRATINVLRKSYVSYLSALQPAMTTNHRRQVAAAMGTSLQMIDLVYRKVK